MELIYFITAQDIKDITQIHANIDERLINPSILAVQDTYLEGILGTAFYNRLCTGISQDNLTTAEKEFIEKHLVKALVYYTMADLPEGLSMQFYNLGVVKPKAAGTDTPTMRDLDRMAARYKNRAEEYVNRTILYLKQHASSALFPEYLSPGTGKDVIRPDDDAYTCGMFLD